MALPPKNLGSRAACSLEDPSPLFSSPKTTQLMPLSLYCLATSGTPPYAPVSWFFTVFISLFSALIAVMRRLLEMFSKWPLYLSQGPAAEMWSVVHLPSTLMRILMSVKSVPIHLSKGDNSWSLSDVGETSTTTDDPSAGGA